MGEISEAQAQLDNAIENAISRLRVSMIQAHAGKFTEVEAVARRFIRELYKLFPKSERHRLPDLLCDVAERIRGEMS